MSIEQVDCAIHQLLLKDKLIESSGLCRYAAKRMVQVAEEADKTPPHVKKEILVWPGPEASADAEEVHYAIKVLSYKGVTVYNPNPAGLFPQYMGPLELAPGYIQKMKVTEKVL